MNRFLVLPLALLFAVGGLAVTYGVEFINGIEHYGPADTVESAVPEVGVKYYLTGDSVTRDSGSAEAYSDITASGDLNVLASSTSGDCAWFGVIDGTPVALGSLDGVSVEAGDRILWAYSANSAGVAGCSVSVDLNVVA